MNAVIVVFPGTNRETDLAEAWTHLSGKTPLMVWHQETILPKADVVFVPGGFSFGDYLRSGAIGARARIMPAIGAFAKQGGTVIGICNGFQMLCEAGLLPGALLHNADLRFICKWQRLEVVSRRSALTTSCETGQSLLVPLAHAQGNYCCDDATHNALKDNDQIMVRYQTAGDGETYGNPNGSRDDIAGISNKSGNVAGLMPHPENAVLPHQAGNDGSHLLRSLLGN